MAHEIDFSTSEKGSAMFAYQPAWHGHGVVVDSAKTTEEALAIAGLDWEVDLTDLEAVMPDGTRRAVSTHRATWRRDTGAVLGAVGMRYKPLQNREAFDWMDQIVGESLAIWHTCGSLRGGRDVWMLAKLPGHIEVTNADVLEKYVLITNNHGGTGAVRLFPTSVRVVCANTLRYATQMADRADRVADGNGEPLGVKLCHTAGALAARVEKARRVLGVIEKAHEGFGAAARRMTQQGLSSRRVSDYFGTLVEGRSQRSRERVLGELWDRFALPTNADGHGATVWTAYNAASEWADHSLRVTGTGAVRAERRFRSALFGASHTFKERAWAGALDLLV